VRKADAGVRSANGGSQLRDAFVCLAIGARSAKAKLTPVPDPACKLVEIARNAARNLQPAAIGRFNNRRRRRRRRIMQSIASNGKAR